MISLTDKGIKFYKAQKVYNKKSFVQIKIMKSLKIKKKSEIIVTTMENLEEQLIEFAK